MPVKPLTRQERAAESLARPLQILARTLYECDAFWDHALALKRSPKPLSLARQRARLYVPRRGNHGEQDVLLALLLVAAESLTERYGRRGGPGLALKWLLEVGAPVAWFTDDQLEAGRLYGLSEPGSRNRMPGLSGRKVSEGGIAGLQRGAEVVRKRGAGVCLAEGCETRLAKGRSKETTGRRYFCDLHGGRRYLLEALDAARAVLTPAGYAYYSLSDRYSVRSVRWSEDRPRIAQADHRVVTRIKAGVRDLSEWQVERELVLDRGLFAEQV